MTADYRAWLSAQQAKNDLTSTSTDQLDALVSFLEGETAATDAAERLVAAASTGKGPVPKEKATAAAYGLVAAASLDFAETHDSLVELVKALAEGEGVDTEPWGWGLRADHDSLKEHAEDAAAKPGNTAALEAAARRLDNFSSFQAKCATAGTINVGRGFLFLTLWGSLESKEATSVSYRHKFEALLPGVTGWLIHAAPSVLAACQAKEASGWNEDESAWKGGKGYSVERWGFWKERVEELRTAGGFGDETVERLRRAGVAMDKAERAMGKKK